MEKIKTIAALSVPYLTICGSLYHVAFWNTFGHNGLEFLEITDIIKSSVYPVLLFGGGYILLEGLFSAPKNVDENENNGCLYHLIGLIVTLFFCYTYSKIETTAWFLWGLGLSWFLTLFSYTRGFLKETITDNKKRYGTIGLIIMTIVFSFCAGKYYSELIYDNIEYKYAILNLKKDSCNGRDTLKYLYSNDNKTIFISIDNKDLIILKYTDTLILQHFPK
jgi:hypothetical protein